MTSWRQIIGCLLIVAFASYVGWTVGVQLRTPPVERTSVVFYDRTVPIDYRQAVGIGEMVTIPNRPMSYQVIAIRHIAKENGESERLLFVEGMCGGAP